MNREEVTRLWNLIFNLAFQMLHSFHDAEDATQEIFIKVQNSLADFRNESQLSTWVYKIAYNYLLSYKSKEKREAITFELFEYDANNYTRYNNEFNLTREEEKIFAEEIKVGCTLAILQCLQPENRLIFILGNILNISNREAAGITGLSYDVYRQRLSRSKSRILNFLKKNCGLINKDANCKCNRRLKIAVDRKRINLDKLLYQTEDKKIVQYIDELNELDEVSKIYQNNPFFDKSELLNSLLKTELNILRDELS